MTDPAFPDLRAFLDQLRRDRDLAVVEVPVDARLEAVEVHRRVIAAGGPALLFRNVQGANLPLATNLFGTRRRAAGVAGADRRWAWPPCAKPRSPWRRAAAAPTPWSWARPPSCRTAARLAIASGRFVTDLDVQDQKGVAVLGASVARALFPFGDPRGERVCVGATTSRPMEALRSE